MNEPEINPKLMKLAGGFFDSTLSSEERQQLQELLHSEDNRELFVELARLEFALNCQDYTETTAQLAASIDCVHRKILSPSVQPLTTAATSFPGRNFQRWSRIVAAVAAVLLVSTLIAGWLRSPKNVPPKGAVASVASETAPVLPAPPPVAVEPNYVARIVGASDDLRWDSAGLPQDVLLRLTAGDQLKIDHGLLELEFGGGATLLLEGPAELKIHDERSAVLVRGAVTGRSTTGDFSLLTPGAEVIDIGTEFGVLVSNSNRTEVAVFEGEVHVKGMHKSTAGDFLKLTTGMRARVDELGNARRASEPMPQEFRRRLGDGVTPNLGAREVSLVDVISGGDVGEFRLAGAIDSRTGHWSQGPWVESLGVERADSAGRFVSVNWNPLVHGVFVPSAEGGATVIDGRGGMVDLPATSGSAWGPVWARRRIDANLDPLQQLAERDIQGFWGAGTVSALLDRSRYAGDGLVGMHANIGVTLDLEAIRQSRQASVRAIRGVIAHLEPTRDSQPFQPNSLADFRLFVDGELRYERLGFSRRDGDAQFGAEIRAGDRFLTLVVTDGGDGPTYDRIILVDPVLELATP